MRLEVGSRDGYLFCVQKDQHESGRNEAAEKYDVSNGHVVSAESLMSAAVPANARHAPIIQSAGTPALRLEMSRKEILERNSRITPSRSSRLDHPTLLVYISERYSSSRQYADSNRKPSMIQAVFRPSGTAFAAGSR
jgi:hypothetical protein